MIAEPSSTGTQCSSLPSDPPDRVEMLAPTFLEYVSALMLRPRRSPTYAGMRLSRWKRDENGVAVIICGLAGSLVPELQPGDVFIPSEFAAPNGDVRRCDSTLVDILTTAARRLGFSPRSGRLLTAPNIVTGSDRAMWAERGFDAVDMETGLVPAELRVATVRVVLDGPKRPLSAMWVSPVKMLTNPVMARELLWLGRSAPAFALRAARVADAGMRALSYQRPT
jgi:hypothetical protein